MKNRDCYPVNSGYLTKMDTSVKALEEAISIRRQIETLESRLSSILGGRALPTTTTRAAGARYFSPATRAKLAAAAKARWARLRGPAPATPAKKKGQLTPGMQADFAAYEHDPMTIDDPRGLRPVLTVSLGREVSAP